MTLKEMYEIGKVERAEMQEMNEQFMQYRKAHSSGEMSELEYENKRNAHIKRARELMRQISRKEAEMRLNIH